MNILADSDLLVIRVVNGKPVDYPITYSNFRLINPQVSFPETPDNSFLTNFGFCVFNHVSAPASKPFVHLQDGPFVRDEERDVWVNTHVEVPFTPEEMELVKLRQIGHLRDERNLRLARSDYTQLPDTGFTAKEIADWRVYRQALRDYMSLIVDPLDPPEFPLTPR